MKEKQRISMMREQWANREAKRPADDKQSAVLIPLIETKNGLEILFEMRALDLVVQPGDICLPGGRIETGETSREAAIRETCEELLVQSAQIQVLAPMDGVLGPAQTIIWPYLATLEGYHNTFSEAEVDHVFTIPLDWFLSQEPERHVSWMINQPEEDFPYELIHGGKNYGFRKRPHEMLFYKHDHATIWGATARIVNEFVLLYKKTFQPFSNG